MQPSPDRSVRSSLSETPVNGRLPVLVTVIRYKTVVPVGTVMLDPNAPVAEAPTSLVIPMLWIGGTGTPTTRARAWTVCGSGPVTLAVAVLTVVPRGARAVYVQVKDAPTARVAGMLQPPRSAWSSTRVTPLSATSPLLVTVIW